MSPGGRTYHTLYSASILTRELPHVYGGLSIFWFHFLRTNRIAEEEQGIIPRVITGMYDLLREALEERPNVSYSVRCQFLEIYGEDIHDLLEPAGSTVTIREGQNGEVNVHGAKEMLVNGAEVKETDRENPWL